MATSTASSNSGIWKASERSALNGEGRTIEDELVLSAELVGIDHRQAAFDDLADDDLMADIDLAAIIGRAVRNEQHLRAAFGQRLADVGIPPDVLADRYADAHRHGS